MPPQQPVPLAPVPLQPGPLPIPQAAPAAGKAGLTAATLEVAAITVKFVTDSAVLRFSLPYPLPATAALKSLIADQIGTPAAQQRLIFAGRVLSDEQSLASVSGFGDGSCVICQFLKPANAQ